MLTHRRTSKESLAERDSYILFCDDDGNSHYGDHCWTLKTDLPEVTRDIIEFAAEFFGCSIEEAEKGLNPENIVNTADMWDDEQFVCEVWQFHGEPTGFKTPDGAVVLDIHGVELEYSYDPQ